MRPGAGDPDPTVDLRALDDRDVGWQSGSGDPAGDPGGHPAGDTNDERLRRDVPPHW